jgi:hypothetical protein
MKASFRAGAIAAGLALASPALATVSLEQLNVTVPGSGSPFNFLWDSTNSWPVVGATITAANPTNPSVTLVISGTTTYGAGTVIGNPTACGGACSFTTAFNNGAARAPAIELYSNDTAAWGAQSIQIDAWSASPTMTNADGGAYRVTTGAGTHLWSWTCAMSALQGDGTYAECPLTVSGTNGSHLLSGSPPTVYLTFQAVTGSGVAVTNAKTIKATIFLDN